MGRKLGVGCGGVGRCLEGRYVVRGLCGVV